MAFIWPKPKQQLLTSIFSHNQTLDYLVEETLILCYDRGVLIIQEFALRVLRRVPSMWFSFLRVVQNTDNLGLLFAIIPHDVISHL